jgi:Na+-driven multidrug efflux pump
MSALAMVQIAIWIPDKILALYTNDVKIIQDGVSVLYVLCGAIIILSVSWVLFNAVLGTGDTRYALLIEILCISIYLIYIWWVIIFLKQPLHIAWTSEYVYIGLMGILSYIYIKSNKWTKVKV